MKKILHFLMKQPHADCLSLISTISSPQPDRIQFKMNRSFFASLSIAMLFIGQVAIGQTTIDNQTFAVNSSPVGWTATDITFNGSYAKFDVNTSQLISPTYNLTGYTNVKLTFSVAKFGNGNNGPLTVDVSNDGGATWTAQTFTSGTPTNSDYVTTTNQSITVTGSMVKIRFSKNDNNSAKRFKDYKLTGTISAPPVVTAATVNGTVGTAITPYQIVASNSPTAYVVASGVLPAGLTLNTTTGIITGTPTTVGNSTANVTASNANGTSAPAALNFVIAKGNQTITFNALANRQYGDADFNLTATSTTATPITYTSSNTAVATILANVVTVVGVGSTTITASQAGTANYNAATPVDRTLTVTPKTVTIAGLTADAKQEDGTTAATLSGTATLVGILAADTADVTLSGTPTATFASAAPGTGIAVTVTGYSLTGTKASNYALTQPAGLTADITALGTPLATDATLITPTSFTANWNAVAGATSYSLDVYQVISGGNASDLFISEYIEGSGNNKAIEIYNGTGSSVDLANYTLKKQSNGSGDFVNELSLSGTLADGDTYVIVNNSATSALKDLANLTTTSLSLTFNGNDAVALYNGSTQIDVVGFVDDSSNWGQNVTLVRNADASVPKIAYDDADFTEFAEDTFSNIGLHTFSGGSATTFIIENQNVGNVTSFDVTVLTESTQYFYVVRAISGSTSPNSNEIEVLTIGGTSTTWDGMMWSNGVPTATIDAIIEGDLTLTADLDAKSVTINIGILTVGSDVTLNVVNEIVNTLTEDNFVIENNGIVLQTLPVANGVLATFKRNSSNLYRQDYTSWSSPVSGQNLKAFSPATVQSRFYSYDAAIGTIGDYVSELVTPTDLATKTFTPAQGTLIRMPNTWPVYVDASTPGTSFEGIFKGGLNNGNYSVALSNANIGFNMVGNPYPSPISISEFFAGNPSIVQTLYFWRKRNGAAGSGYATLSALGTTSFQPEGSILPVDLDDTIKAGQGFYVTANGATTLNFDNSMRTNVTGTTFFKTAASSVTEKSRIWLNLSNSTSVVGQMLVGYATGATQGIDNGIDATYFGDSPLALTSVIEGNEYSIQGRSLPFVDSDIVDLGFQTDVAGTFTISLAGFDGLFATDQDIFLKDNITGIAHDLKAGDYSFATEIGVFNNRFELQYTTTLGTNNPILTDDSILIGVKNQKIQINAGSIVMQQIELIDISGRIIYTINDVNATMTTIDNLSVSNQVFIVKIKTAGSGIVTQKIVF